MLTISRDGTKLEDVPLHTLKTKKEMHNLFLEKGFVPKPKDEIERERKMKLEGEEAKVDRRRGTTRKRLREAADPSDTAAGKIKVKETMEKIRLQREKIKANAGGLLLDLAADKNAGDGSKAGGGAAGGAGGAAGVASRKARRSERRQRLEDERRFLGKSSPSGAKMMQLYVVLALAMLAVATYTGLRQHNKNKRRRRVVAGT